MSLYVGGRRAVSNVGTHSFVKENLAREWIRGSVNGSGLTQTDLNNIYMVKPYGFANDNTLTELTLPNCSYVSSCGFLGSSVTNLSLPNCQYIDQSAFSSAYNIQQINLPKLMGVSSYGFSYCENLQEINLPLATYIQQYAFSNCTALKRVLTPSVTTFYGNCFYTCSNLEYVDTSAGRYFYQNSFYNCVKLDSLDLSSAYRVEYYSFRNCTSLRKVWLPASVYYVLCNGQTSPFDSVNPNCLIYTDVVDENSIPSNWGEYWNYYNSNSKLNVIYGATYQDFINETLPTYPYTFTISAPNDCTVKIKYMGIEKTTDTITMKENTTATYTVEKENCIPITGSVTMETTDVTITITSDQFVSIPSTLNINYDNASSGDNPKLLRSLIDDYNFTLNASDHSIINGSKTCLVDANIESHGYLVVKPEFNSVLRVTARIGSENNWDYGGVYVDTQLYEPSWNEVKNGNNYGTGQYLMRICGSNQNPVEYTMNLEKDILYYLNFFYVKDSYLTQPDKVYFDEIVVEKEAEIDIFEQVISGQIATIDNSDITTLQPYAFAACYNLTSVNLPNVTTIGMHAFASCLNLQTLNIPKVTEIPLNCISSNALTELDLPNVTYMNQGAVGGCPYLRKIWISDKCTGMYGAGNPPFRGDTNLTLYTNLTEAPVGWAEGWDYLNYNDGSERISVVWGATHADYENA